MYCYTINFIAAVLSEDFTEVPIKFRQLILSGTHQRVCYSQEIMDDNIIENDEEFTLILRVISQDSVSASVSLLPSVVVVRILDDDGKSICCSYFRLLHAYIYTKM